MEEKPLISIITLNYNQTDVTCAFLESTRMLTYDRFETIIVDNGSKTDPTEQITRGNYPNVRIIVCDENLGFAGGNNVGMRAAKGDFIFLLNDDTEVTSNLIESVLKPFYSDEKVGVVSPKIKFHYSPDTIQYAGFRRMNPYTGRTKMIGNGECDTGQYDVLMETYGSHGAAMMLKREVIEQVGMFAEEFFLYYEEWDWSARIRRAGYKILYQPEAVVYHKESMTVGKESTLKVYYQTRNRILYMKRNTTKRQFFIFSLFFVFLAVPKAIIKYLSYFQFQHALAYIRGAFWKSKLSIL